LNSKILQVLDPSHKNWVLGGLFRDINNESVNYCKQQIFLGSPFSNQNFFSWFITILRILKYKKILFSSITPLENYLKIMKFFPKFQKIGLWFTHQEGLYTENQIYAINYCDFIFVHSLKQKSALEDISNSKIICTLGAVKTQNFNPRAVSGERIVWVGTTAERKNPNSIIDLAVKNPQLDFRILGKGWIGTEYYSAIKNLQNVEYTEIKSALSSRDFDGCDVYLCTSVVEGGPMPLLETIAAGLHPITTDVGFARDVFHFYEIPEMFIYDDAKSITNLILEVRTNKWKYFTYDKSKLESLNFTNLSRKISSEYE
jgi:glycosyltransferase involved in cell wall biosynthesis